MFLLIRYRTISLAGFVFFTLALAAVAQPREEDRRYRLAEGYERSGDLKNASRVYRELFESDPNSALYFEAVRRTYAGLGLNAELLTLVDARIATHPNDYELHVVYADLLFRVGRREEAGAMWKRAIEIGNFQEFVFAIVAQSQTDNRAYDAAIDTYRIARDRSGDRQLFADQLAFIYGSVGRYDDAAAEYLAMLGAAPERLPLVKRAMAEMLSNPTALAAITHAVERAVVRNPDFEPTLELLSWLHDEAGNHAGAFDVAKRLDHVRNSRGSNVYAYADRAFRDGLHDAALTALDYFVATYDRSNPLYAAVLLTYARALDERHRSTGIRDAAQITALIERYKDLAESERGSEVAAEALLRAAQLQVETLDSPGDATETLEDLLEAPKNGNVLPDALILLGDLRVRNDQLDEASVLYDRAVVASVAAGENESGDIARLRRAELALYRGAYKLAVDSLTALTLNTASSVTNDALAHLFILQESVDRYEVALAHYYAGRLLVVQRKWAEASDRFKGVSAAAPGTSLAEEAMLAQAGASNSSGDHLRALDILLAFVATSPEAPVADRALFRAAQIADLNLGESARALELYARLLAEYPRSQHATTARSRIRVLRSG